MPVFIEIERADKPWFTAGEVQSHELTQSIDQIVEWRSWFDQPGNREIFLRDYQIPTHMAQRAWKPEYILVHGRSTEFHGNPFLDRKRAQIQSDIKMMTFDSISPNRNATDWGAVKLRSQGQYEAISVPATFSVIEGAPFTDVARLDDIIDECPDISAERKESLHETLIDLRKQRGPGVHVRVARRR
ncbi:hypothetical protein GCM10027456_39520 [Kineosporia babensis]